MNQFQQIFLVKFQKRHASTLIPQTCTRRVSFCGLHGKDGVKLRFLNDWHSRRSNVAHLSAYLLLKKMGGQTNHAPQSHISHVRFLSKILGWHYKCVCQYFHWTLKSANIYIWSAYHLEVGTLQIVSMPTFLDNIFNGRAPGIRYWRPHPIFGYCCHHLLQRHALSNLRVHTFSLNPWFACMFNVHILIFMRAYS